MKSKLKYLLYVTETFLNRKTRGFKPGNVNRESCVGRLEGGVRDTSKGRGSRTEGGSEQTLTFFTQYISQLFDI